MYSIFFFQNCKRTYMRVVQSDTAVFTTFISRFQSLSLCTEFCRNHWVLYFGWWILFLEQFLGGEYGSHPDSQGTLRVPFTAGANSHRKSSSLWFQPRLTIFNPQMCWFNIGGRLTTLILKSQNHGCSTPLKCGLILGKIFFVHSHKIGVRIQRVHLLKWHPGPAAPRWQTPVLFHISVPHLSLQTGNAGPRQVSILQTELLPSAPFLCSLSLTPVP